MKYLQMDTAWGNTLQIVSHPSMCLGCHSTSKVTIKLHTGLCKLGDARAGSRKGEFCVCVWRSSAALC